MTTNRARLTVCGVYRQGGTMTTTNSPISANTPNNQGKRHDRLTFNGSDVE